MTAIVRNNFRIYNARTFISSLVPVDAVTQNSLYLGIGRPQPWSDTSDSPSEPANSIQHELTDWSDLMHMKRVFSSNISHVVPKRLWSPNSIYDMYRHDWNGFVDLEDNNVTSEINGETPPDLSKVNCYCISSTKKIYLCIQSARLSNGTVAPSTVDPDEGTTTVPGTSFVTTSNTSLKYTSDGYVWLQLADSTDFSSFETADYFPVNLANAGSTGNSAVQYSWQTDGESFKGGVYNIIVATKGSGYNGGANGIFEISDSSSGEVTTGDGTPHVKVVGDGVGMKYVVKYVSGSLTEIIVTNPGTGYTWANVYVVNAGGAGATAKAILSPLHGISCDPIKTLNAYFTSINVVISDDENTGDAAIVHGVDFTVVNDYRKIMLISNPKLTVGGGLAEASRIDMTYGLTTSSQTNIQPDDILTNGTCRVRVVDASPADSLIRVVQTDLDKTGTQSNTDIITGTYTKTGGSAVVTAITQPGCIRGSGDVVYADYRRPVMRAPLQSEQFKIILEF